MLKTKLATIDLLCYRNAFTSKNGGDFMQKEFNCCCSQCGASLYRDGYRMRRSSHHFCSITCRNKFYPNKKGMPGIQKFGEDNPNWRGGKKLNTVCDFCGIEIYKPNYELKRNRGKFCSMACRNKAYPPPPTHFPPPMKGDKNPNWKGGRYVEPGKGYVMIRKPDHHRSRSNGYVCEHILLAENKIGRPIELKEHVHHKNRQRSDNEIDNLEVYPGIKEHFTIGHKDDIDSKYKELVCPMCDLVFKRRKSSIKSSVVCCSRSCARQFRLVSNKPEGLKHGSV